MDDTLYENVDLDKTREYLDKDGFHWKYDWEDKVWTFDNKIDGDNYRPGHPQRVFGTYFPVVRHKDWHVAHEYDEVNKPKHYEIVKGLEAINIIEALLTPEEFIGYLKGNQLKYSLRAGKKDNEITDRKKSSWYTEKLVEKLEEEME